MLVLPEDMRHIRNPLNPIPHQRADRLLGSIWRPLTRQNNRTQLQRSLLHIRNLQVGFEAPHPPRLVLPHHKLQMVTPRSQRKSAGILNILALHLLRCIERQFHRIANIANNDPLRILDLPNDVDVCLALISILDEGNL